MFPIFEDRREDLSISPFHNLVFPEHLHNHIELIYVHEGSKRLRIGAQTVQLNAGDMAVVFPNLVHSYLEQDESCSGTLLICTPSITPDFQAKLRTHVPQNPVLRTEILHEDVALCLRRLTGDEPMQIKKAFLHLLLCRAVPCLALEKLENSAQADILTRAIRYISQNYMAPLSLQQVAHALGVNTYYLSHVFSARMHVSLRRYLNSLRIAMARRLLESTDTPITQICFECGFENLRTFDRVFLAQTGLTPRAYRSQHG